MSLKTKKENRKDIREIAKNSKELFDYLLHLTEILIDPKAHDVSEREIHEFQTELIAVLKKLDKNNNRIIGHLTYELVRKEAYTNTFNFDQYLDYNVYIKANNK
jgi:hypothetical protein